MKLSDVVAAARASGNWTPLVDMIPYARFLNMSIDVKGDVFSCTMPFDTKLIGNPILPALHGGATGGFMESTGLFYLLWHMDSSELPKTIDFSFDFLRSGRPENVYANVFMVKQGQRVAHLRIEAWQSSPDKPIAIGHGNFMLKPALSSKGSP
jgi:uncharacterized protein (TIGR00369 family)